MAETDMRPLLAVSVDRIEDEAAAVVQTARSGGPAALRKTLEDCWFKHAGYGVESLGICVTLERAGLALVRALEAKIGPLDDPQLTPIAAQDRIETAYEARGEKARRLTDRAEALVAYAVARRVQPGWDGAPSLRDVSEWTEAARRVLQRDGASAARDLVSRCWARLVLATPVDTSKASAAAWRCRIENLAVLADPATAAPERERVFEQLTGAAPEATAAVATVIRALQATR